MSLPPDDAVGQPSRPPANQGPRFQELEATAKRAASKVQALPTRADFDRSRIALTVMAVYGIAVLGTGFFLVLRGLCGGSEYAGVSKELSDLIKTAVVPIVTLVLGYYFGRSGRT